jgi:HEPN domain-containing protein
MVSIPWNVDGSSNTLDMSIELESITGNHTADRVTLVIPTLIKPVPETMQQLKWNEPTLFEVHGLLYAAKQPADPGVPLLPFQPNPPTQAQNLQYAFSLPLVFELTHAYVRYLEDFRRQTQPNANMMLKVQLWGKIMRTSKDGNGNSVREFSYFTTSGYPETPIRIPRSDWLDTILPSLGYDKILLVEVPLPQHPTASEELKEAIQYLEQARDSLKHEKYKPAVQHCRQAKEVLIKRSGGALKDLLVPLIGNTKTKAVDDTLLAFKDLYEASSHAPRPNEERVEFTRDDAAFAVNSLTFILDYLSHVLIAQSVT